MKRNRCPYLAHSTLAIIALLVVVCTGCGNTKKVPSKLELLADPSITAPGKPLATSVRVDVCLDATPSMAGFAVDPRSEYLTLLDELEGAVQNRLRDSTVRYFKFGEAIRQVSRDEFRSAKGAVFYNEPGIFKQTNIDQVFLREGPRPGPLAASTLVGRPASTASEAVAIVVTDLFQHDNDVNLVVSQIRRNCLELGCSVGLLPVMSEFDGMVFDARVPSFPYKSTPGNPRTRRPFYLLFFGEQDRIEELVELLSARPYIDRNRLLLVSPKIVRHYSVAVSKDPTSKDLNLRHAPGAADEFEFALRRGGTGGVLRVDFQYDPIMASPVVDPTGIQIEVRTGARGMAGKPTEALKLLTATAIGNKVSTTIALDLPGPPGEYEFQLLFRVGGAGAFTAPSWVSELSSDNPTPADGPAKTLNLKRLVDELIGASLAVQPPPLARAFVTVKKLG